MQKAASEAATSFGSFMGSATLINPALGGGGKKKEEGFLWAGPRIIENWVLRHHAVRFLYGVLLP